MTLGDYKKRVAAYEKAFELVRGTGDINGEGLALMNIGFSYSESGERGKALNYLLKAVEKFNAVSNKYYESMVYWSIAGIHDALGSPETALGYYLLAERVSGSEQHVISVADVLDRLGRFDEAEKYYKKLIAALKKRSDFFGLLNTYRAMGTHYSRQAKFNTSIQYLHLSLAASVKLRDTHSVLSSRASTTAILGEVYAQIGKTAAAVEKLEQARREFSRSAIAVKKRKC